MFIYFFVAISTIPFLISCQNLEEAWNSYQSSLSNQNREELTITNVTAQEVLSLKSNVTAWRSINIGPICYSVGLADSGLEILISVLNDNKSGFVFTTNYIPTANKPKDVVVFHNRRNFKSECVIVISFYNQNKLKWMKIVDMFVHKNFWSWTLDDQVEHISYFKMARRNILFITTNSSDGFLYEFDINSSPLKKWFLQNIQLQSPATLTTFNNFKTNYFLSVLQPDQVVIYKYQREKFIFHSKLRSLNVNQITSFNIGFKTFLAMNGNGTGIYEFSERGVVKQNIENSNLNGITFWLSVPIQTYRDEVLLIGQRIVDHATHVNNEVDIFTYNGHKFEEHEDIPCFLFEENTSRLTCLTQNKGIAGSSYIVVENVVGLTVPKSDNSSVIFTINFTLKQIPNPTEKKLRDLLHLKEKLKIAIEKKMKMYEDLTNSMMSYTTSKDKLPPTDDVIIGQPQNFSKYLVQLNHIGEEIDKLSNRVDKLSGNRDRRNFKSITFNGKVKFEGALTVKEAEVENIGGQKAAELFAGIVRRDNITGIIKNKTFVDMLQVVELHASTINKIDSKDIIFADDAATVLNGNVTFEKPVLIGNVRLRSGNINNIKLENEAVIMGRNHEGNLAFEDINVKDNLRAAKINDVNLIKHSGARSNALDETNSTDFDEIFIPHNVTVTYINGENFTQFLHSLCLINLTCTIPGKVEITDKIEASEIITDYLNDLKFPDEYILHNSTAEVNITGRKHFAALKTKEITVTGFVNGIDTRNVITTSTEQHLGNKSFRHFGLTDELRVEGKIVGNLVENFLTNPPLPEVDDIKANVVFKNLEVKGNIFIENNFNQENYRLLLQDIVYHDDPNATISCLKKFPEGFEASTLDIKSSSINNINLSSIVTQDTDQQLNFNLLNGSVKIENLFVRGTYDSANLTELENLIKLDGNQFINSSLTFDDVEVENLEIFETLNNVSKDEYLYTTDGGRIAPGAMFDKIIVENMIVEGNISGNVSKFDLKNLSENYLSRIRNQSLKFDINIHESRIDSLSAMKINGSDEKLILNEDDFKEKLIRKLNSGNITVKNLTVTDSIELKTVNNKSFDDISPNALHEYLKRKNTTEITFENDIYVPAIKITQLSFVDWEDYVKQLVFKNETNVTFSGNKTFQNSITVEKLIETEKLNNITLKDILRKGDNQTITAPLQIEGDVTLKRADVRETMNDVSVPSVLKIISISNGSYYLRSDVIFRRLPYIESLKVHGKINDKNISEVFEDVAFKDKDIIFRNDTIFKEPVFIAGNLAIKNNLNHVNFGDLVSNIVLTTTDADIDSLVTFSKTVLVLEKLTVDESLSAHTIGGFNVSNWIDRSISLEKGLIGGHYTFEHVYINNNLITNFVNEINMKKLVPLGTNQSIDYMEFSRLKFVSDIPVGKTVNHLYLSEEVNRTLIMNDVDQEIQPKINFKNIILIRRNLNVSSLNNESTSKIVTTNTDQILTSDYHFNAKSIVDSNLQVDGFINEVDFKKWKTNSLKVASKNTQLISNDWKLENLTFINDVQGIDKINGLNLSQVSSEVEDRKNKKLQFEHTILDDYKGICEDVTFLYDKAKSQIFKLKYLEDFQTISFHSEIKTVNDFIYNDKHYLLVNQENCMTDIYVFNGTQFLPLVTNVKTDQFEQVVPVVDEDVLFLVTRGNHHSTCDIIAGVNIWVFDEEGLHLMYNMENQDLIQESLVPSTFYTIGKDGVIEHKIKKNSEGPIRYRKWDVFDGDTAFVPRGLKTGLAVSTGKELIFLERSEPIVEEIETNVFSEIVIKGSVKGVPNTYIPGRHGGDVAVLNVGIKSTKNNLLAVASHEKTIVRDSLDFVKIYDDPLSGEVFDKVLTYRPSSLLSIEFGQGETLLAFLENKRILQVYEYKGIEGFEHRISIKMKASKIFKMDLSFGNQQHPTKAIGAIHKNKVKILIAVMDGSKINDNLHCEL